MLLPGDIAPLLRHSKVLQASCAPSPRRLEDVKDEGISTREASAEPSTASKSGKEQMPQGPSATDEERAHSHKHPSDAALASADHGGPGKKSAALSHQPKPEPSTPGEQAEGEDPAQSTRTLGGKKLKLSEGEIKAGTVGAEQTGGQPSVVLLLRASTFLCVAAFGLR